MILALSIPVAAANPRSALKGSTPPWANNGNLSGAVDPNEGVNFRVYLNINSAAEAYALAVSDPRSASYGQFLTPSQFNARFAPSSSDVAAVSSWLQSQGLNVDFVPSNNHFVAADGTAAQVEAAFSTKLARYTVNGNSLRAPQSDLQVPNALAKSIARGTARRRPPPPPLHHYS